MMLSIDAYLKVRIRIEKAHSSPMKIVVAANIVAVMYVCNEII